jgi:branched-chain amino acid transport system permease protein
MIQLEVGKLHAVSKVKMIYVWIAVGLIALVLPLIIRDNYVQRLVIMVGVYSILALSLNLVAGYTGQLSIGHAAFYGIGAYVSAILSIEMHIPFWFALPIAGVVAAALGLVVGIPSLRLRGDYLAIVTIAFGEVIRLIFLNWVGVTRGPMGIPGIPKPSLFGVVLRDNASFYYLMLVLLGFTIFVVYRIVNSRLGRALVAIRDDEVAARATGIDITRLKVLVFVVGAFFAGIAGSYYAHFMTYINPDNFIYMESVTILCMVVLGGIGSIPGSILGAAILTLAPELLRNAIQFRMVLFGATMVLLMLFRPQGFLGLARKRSEVGGQA